jgi:hypothetical protein
MQYSTPQNVGNSREITGIAGNTDSLLTACFRTFAKITASRRRGLMIPRSCVRFPPSPPRESSSDQFSQRGMSTVGAIPRNEEPPGTGGSRWAVSRHAQDCHLQPSEQ